jgi:hypothetical protein
VSTSLTGRIDEPFHPVDVVAFWVMAPIGARRAKPQ